MVSGRSKRGRGAGGGEREVGEGEEWFGLRAGEAGRVERGVKEGRKEGCAVYTLQGSILPLPGLI